MAISRELRIPVQDVSRLAITCEHCEGEVVIDLTNSGHVDRIVPNVVGGAACPLCGQAFGQGLREIIVKLQEAFKALKGSAHSVSFCVLDRAIPQN
jgi:hypothetical protein